MVAPGNSAPEGKAYVEVITLESSEENHDAEALGLLPKKGVPASTTQKEGGKEENLVAEVGEKAGNDKAQLTDKASGDTTLGKVNQGAQFPMNVGKDPLPDLRSYMTQLEEILAWRDEIVGIEKKFDTKKVRSSMLHTMVQSINFTGVNACIFWIRCLLRCLQLNEGSLEGSPLPTPNEFQRNKELLIKYCSVLHHTVGIHGKISQAAWRGETHPSDKEYLFLQAQLRKLQCQIRASRLGAGINAEKNVFFSGSVAYEKAKPQQAGTAGERRRSRSPR